MRQLDTKGQNLEGATSLADLVAVRPSESMVTGKEVTAGAEKFDQVNLLSSNLAIERQRTPEVSAEQLQARMSGKLSVDTPIVVGTHRNVEIRAVVSEVDRTAYLGAAVNPKTGLPPPFAGRTILDKLVNFVVYLIKRFERFLFRMLESLGRKKAVLVTAAPRVKPAAQQKQPQTQQQLDRARVEQELLLSNAQKPKKQSRWIRWSQE